MTAALIIDLTLWGSVAALAFLVWRRGRVVLVAAAREGTMDFINIVPRIGLGVIGSGYIAAVIPQEVITGSLIDGELAPPAVVSGGSAHHGVDNLGGAVEVYLSSHFSSFPNGVPPPGLYHRILREIEVPLLTAALAATRGNQIRAADLLGLNRNTLRKKIRDLDIQVYRTGS